MHFSHGAGEVSFCGELEMTDVDPYSLEYYTYNYYYFSFKSQIHKIIISNVLYCCKIFSISIQYIYHSQKMLLLILVLCPPIMLSEFINLTKWLLLKCSSSKFHHKSHRILFEPSMILISGVLSVYEWCLQILKYCKPLPINNQF